MALGKTGENAIAYTPFNKTSFGYTTADLTGPHSGLTNVKVIITPKSGTNHWDDTGHISTTGSGSAVASYNSDKLEWSCVGTLADVAGVLDNLDFFPADFPAVRTWSTLPMKPNQTSGNFPIYQTRSEEPASDDPIPDTVFDLKVYDADDIGAGAEATYTVTFDPTQPTFGKQRPYWSTEPTNEDLATSAHGETTGGLLDLGVISQLNPSTSVSDTDPLTVTCEFRAFESTSTYSGTAYGQFTLTDTNMFIGDKKPATIDNYTKRLNFTGTKAEVQAYLDNVRFYRNGNYDAFDMYLTISNGVVGAYFTKHVWFSDAIIGLTGLDTTQSYAEDTAIVWDFGDYTTSNVSPDADEFNAIITLDSVGKGGVSLFGPTGTQYWTSWNYDSPTGVLTVTADTESGLKDTLRSIWFGPEADFNATNWTMSVQLNHTGSVNDSSYTSTPQTVTVTSGGDVAELSYHNNTHTWTEDTVYEFSVGGVTGNPEIAHLGDNITWSMALTLSDAAAGSLVVPSPTSTYGTMTPGGSGVYTLTGTKTEVNAGLAAMQFIPAADYDSDFDITFVAERTSGNLEHQVDESGTYTMTATAVGDYSISQLTGVDWNEDEDKTFNSGLAITDIAADDSRLPEYGSEYRLEIAMFEDAATETAFTDGTIVANTTTGLDKAGAGNENGQGDTNMISYTGTKAEVNDALADLKFIPDVDYDDIGPYVNYKLVRVSDGGVITNQSASTRTEFNSASNTGEFSYTHQSDLSWDEDEATLFDTGVQITDKADENDDYSQYQSDYTASLQLKEWTDSPYNTITTATINVLTSITGLTTVVNSSGTTITGNKTQVNLALQNLKMMPDMDWLASPVTGANAGKFFTPIDVTRDSDGVLVVDSGVYPYPWIGFNPGTDSSEYVTSVTGMTYDEDTPKTIFNGLTVGITDKAADNFPNITYVVAVLLSDTGAGEWTGTGSHIKVLTGTKAVVNAAIQALEFTPTIDYSSNFSILYSQERFINGVSDTTHATDVNIGPINGTATPHGDYYTGITGMTYTEDIYPQWIFYAHDIGISDIAGDNYANVTYEVTITIPSAAGELVDGTTVMTPWTMTGTKAAVNTGIRGIKFSPSPDYNTNFNVTYSQIRHISGGSSTTHADAVNVGTVVGTPVGEFAYGTANGNKQYTVQDGAVATSSGQVLSPKNLTENWSKTYERPLTITDLYEDVGGASEYKIVFTVPSGTTLYDNTDTDISGTLDWDTRANIHTKLDQGIRISGVTGSFPTYPAPPVTGDLDLAFTLHRKTSDGTEKQLGSGTLPYTYLQNPIIINHSSGRRGNAISESNPNNYQASPILSGDEIFTITSGKEEDDIDRDWAFDWYACFQLDVGEVTITNLTPGGYYKNYALPTGETITTTIDDIDVLATSSYWTKTYETIEDSWSCSFDSGTCSENKKRIRISVAELPSPTIVNTSAVVNTHYGTTVTIANIDLNQAYTHASPVYSTPTDKFRVSQSNYWDGTYMNIAQFTLKVDGTSDLVGGDDGSLIAKRHATETGGTTWEDGWERAIVSGPRGYFYGFRTVRDIASSGDVDIDVHIKQTPTGTTVTTYPTLTIKSGYSTNGEHTDCWIQQVIHDSSNDDVYVLSMLEVGDEAKYAIISKLHWTGSAYTWTIIKEIQLQTSIEYWAVEAYLSDAFDSLVTIQKQYDSSSYDTEETGYNRRLRVYDKDQGGANNWGLAVTQNWYRSEWGDEGTKRLHGYTDVDYCAYNGVDTIFSQGAYRVFKKSEGGTNNWGSLTYNGFGTMAGPWTVPKYTQNYLVLGDGDVGGTYGAYIGIWDPDTLMEQWGIKTRFIQNHPLDEDPTSSSIGCARVVMIEASRDHDIVGIYFDQCYSYMGNSNAGIKMYQLTT